jgi:hypothetical protein
MEARKTRIVRTPGKMPRCPGARGCVECPGPDVRHVLSSRQVTLPPMALMVAAPPREPRAKETNLLRPWPPAAHR